MQIAKYLSGEVSIVHYFKNYELGKLVLTRLRSPREWKNRTRLDEHYFFYYPLPPEDDLWKKNMYVNK